MGKAGSEKNTLIKSLWRKRLSRLWTEIPEFWRFQILGWAAFSIFSFPLKWVVLGDVSISLLVAAVRDGTGFFLSVGMRQIYRRVYGRGVLQVALAILSCSVIAGGILTGLALWFHDAVDLAEEKIIYPSMIFAIFYFRTGLMGAWSLLYFGIKLLRDKLAKEAEAARAEAERQRAKLQALRAQMNPHFLFNALNTIQAGLTRHPDRLAPVVQALADYLSFSLTFRERDLVPIGEEFDALTSYLAVEKARFRDDLELETSIELAARCLPAPGILLQPLVENAIHYGRQTSPKPLRLRMRVAQVAGGLILEVSNTGTWIAEGDGRPGGGVGLSNLRERMQLLCPNRHKIAVSELAGWITIRVEIAP